MLNFNHLYYFYMTAKSGTVTSAAEHLHISQPSLSSQLKVLEGTLNVKLFRKHGRNNHLTDDGQLIFGYCQRMFETAEDLTASMAFRTSPSKRMINIGVSNEVERGFVGLFVDKFLRQTGIDHLPKVKVTSGTHEQLAEGLKFRELDIILTQSPLVEPEVVGLQCAEIPVMLAVCKDPSKWIVDGLRDQEVTSDSFFYSPETRWIMPFPGIKLRSEIDHFYEKHHLQGRVILESDAVASQLQSVIDGLGVAFFPMTYLSLETQKTSIDLLGPKGGFWKHSLWLGCHTRSQGDPEVLLLAGAFNAVCTSTSPESYGH